MGKGNFGRLVEARRSLRTRRERGAVLVEAAICSVLLIFLAGGILEFGSLFASTIDTSSAVRSGVRAGSATNSDGPPSDFQVLSAMKAQLDTKSSRVTKVVVYKADDAAATDGPPGACRNLPVDSSASNCNVYGQMHFSMNEAQLTASPGAQGWKQADRKGGIDHLGVWADTDSVRLFGLVPAPDRYKDHLVALIDAEPVQSSSSGWGSGTDPGAIPPYTSTFCFNGQCTTPGNGADPGGGGPGGST